MRPPEDMYHDAAELFVVSGSRTELQPGSRWGRDKRLNLLVGQIYRVRFCPRRTDVPPSPTKDELAVTHLSTSTIPRSVSKFTRIQFRRTLMAGSLFDCELNSCLRSRKCRLRLDMDTPPPAGRHGHTIHHRPY